MTELHDDLSQRDVSKQLYSIKLQKKDVDSQVKILKNRLQMLETEEAKQSHIIQNHQNKIQKLIEIDQFRQDIQQMTQLTYFRLNKQQKEAQKKAQTFRLSQDSKMAQIRQEQINHKRYEHQEIQKQHSNNRANIQKFKLSCQNFNRLRANYIKDCRQQQKENVSNYWESRFLNFSQEKNMIKDKLEREKRQQDKLLEKLLDEESRRISRLQESLEMKGKLEHIMKDTLNRNQNQNNRFTRINVEHFDTEQ